MDFFKLSIYWGQTFLPKFIIPEKTPYADICLKPIYGQYFIIIIIIIIIIIYLFIYLFSYFWLIQLI